MRLNAGQALEYPRAFGNRSSAAAAAAGGGEDFKVALQATPHRQELVHANAIQHGVQGSQVAGLIGAQHTCRG